MYTASFLNRTKFRAVNMKNRHIDIMIMYKLNIMDLDDGVLPQNGAIYIIEPACFV